MDLWNTLRLVGLMIGGGLVMLIVLVYVCAGLSYGAAVIRAACTKAPDGMKRPMTDGF